MPNFTFNKNSPDFIKGVIVAGKGSSTIGQATQDALDLKQNLIQIEAADETAMLALTTVVQNDIVKRTDEKALFQLTGTDPTQISDWTQLSISETDLQNAINALQTNIDNKQNKIVKTAANETAMLNIAGLEQYDIVRRTDGGDNQTQWLFTGTNNTIPTSLNDWVNIGGNNAPLLSENINDMWIDPTSGLVSPANPSRSQPFQDINEAISESNYNGTGLVLHLGAGTYSINQITQNIGGSGLTIKGEGNAKDVIIDGLNIQSSTGKVILENVTVNDLTVANIPLEIKNGIITGVFSFTTNNQRIFFNNTDYSALVSPANFNVTVAGDLNNNAVIDIGTSSIGENLVIYDGTSLVVNGNVQDSIFDTKESVITSAVSDPSTLTNVKAGDRHIISSFSPVNAWTGQSGDLAVANIENASPTNPADWTFSTPANGSWFYSANTALNDGLNEWFQKSGSFFISYGNNRRVIIDGKLADTGDEGLMSKPYHDEVTNVNTISIGSDSNIEDINIEGGNLTPIPPETIDGVVYDREYQVELEEINTYLYTKFRNTKVKLPIQTDLTGEALSLSDGKVYKITHATIAGVDKDMVITSDDFKDIADTIPVTFRTPDGAVTTSLTLPEGSSSNLRWSPERGQFEEQE